VRAESGDGWFALGGEPALTDADIAGAEDAQISGNLTEETARQTASILDSGPLPGMLTSTGG
jgi:preprotein translocase subunit SecD